MTWDGIGDPCRVLFNQPLLQSRGFLHADDSNALPHCNIGSGSPQHSQQPGKNIPLDLFFDSFRFHNGPCHQIWNQGHWTTRKVQREILTLKGGTVCQTVSEARLFIFSGQWDQLPRGQMSILDAIAIGYLTIFTRQPYMALSIFEPSNIVGESPTSLL